MRSTKEILSRIRQEATNARLYWSWEADADGRVVGRPAVLPSPAAIRNALAESAHARDVIRRADAVLEHRFELLGYKVETGPEIEWRRDYIHGKATLPAYFRRIPYLDFSRSGDHKVIWELNRHQHLALLAQAYVLTNDARYVREIERELDSWRQQNPMHRGINWTSALEVAFRALSWIWVDHLAGDAMHSEARRSLIHGIRLHGAHLAANLSYYFSPNTHLLGEAVALHAIGKLYPAFSDAARWQETGREVVEHEIRRQVHDDGLHFEQSTYYHVYAVDMFLFHMVIARDTTAEYRDKLVRMADALAALLGPHRELPFFGDDDGGRLFYPYGARARFGRATLATAARLLGREWPFETPDLFEQAAWWIGAFEACGAGKWESRLFGHSGLAVMCAGGRHIVADAGPFGPGTAGHSHSDTLSLTLRVAGEEILIDPGTYTYVSDPAQRDLFRGSAAHNTIRIDGRDQGVPAGPFAWSDKPAVRLIRWSSTPDDDYLEAECDSAGCTHRRSIRFRKPDLLEIEDDVRGSGEHEIEQFWHLGSDAARRRFTFAHESVVIQGSRSRVLGQREDATVLLVKQKAALPVTFRTTIRLNA